jgi:hypothetical protein
MPCRILAPSRTDPGAVGREPARQRRMVTPDVAAIGVAEARPPWILRGGRGRAADSPCRSPQRQRAAQHKSFVGELWLAGGGSRLWARSRGGWQRRRLLRRVPLYVTRQAGAGVELKLPGTVGYRGACNGRLPLVSRWPGRVALGGSACSALGREQGSAGDDRRVAGTAACGPGDSQAAVRHPRSAPAGRPAGCSPQSRQPTWLHAGCHAGRSAGRRRGCDLSAEAGLALRAPGRSAHRPPAPRSPFLPALT